MEISSFLWKTFTFLLFYFFVCWSVVLLSVCKGRARVSCFTRESQASSLRGVSLSLHSLTAAHTGPCLGPFHRTMQNHHLKEHLYKILVIGDLGVGKTSIIKRYVHQNFSANYRATIGVDFALKVLSLEHETVRLQLWDIAGKSKTLFNFRNQKVFKFR